jgi:hypothetical protein
MASYEYNTEAKKYGHTMVVLLPRDWHDFNLVEIGGDYYVTGNSKRMIYSKKRTIGSKRYTMRYRFAWGDSLYPLLTLSKQHVLEMGIEENDRVNVKVDGDGTITVRKAG